jgi:hypothetical protein
MSRILHRSFALGQNFRMARNGSEIYPGSPTTLFSPPALEYFAHANLGLDSEKMFNVYIWTYHTTAKEERERMSPVAKIFSYFTPHVKPKFQDLED